MDPTVNLPAANFQFILKDIAWHYISRMISMKGNLHNERASTQAEDSLSEMNVSFPVVQVDLKALPPLVESIARLLKDAGASHFAFFGGAIRDADYSARHGEFRQIKDYDIRVWFSNEGFEVQREQFLRNLEIFAGGIVQELPCPGTNKLHYVLTFQGSELDISIRGIPAQWTMNVPTEAVAQERAADSDIGLCSIALDPDFRAWARPEYLVDQEQKTLTVFPIADMNRKASYAARMLAKFPLHRLVESEKR